MRFRNKPVLFAYFLSFLAIVSTLLVAAWSTMAGRMISLMEKEAEQSIHVSLAHLSSEMDLLIEELNHTVLELCQNPKLSLYKVNSGGYEASLIREELEKYRSSNSIIQVICIHYCDAAYVATSEGFYSRRDYFRYIRNYSQWPETQIYEDLENCAAPYFRPLENVIEGTSVSQYMTYIYPTPSGMAAAGGVFFLIDEQQMQQRISRALGAYEGSVFLFNSEGELLISNQTQDSQLDGTEVARTISQNGDSSFFQTEFGGDSYTVTVASSHGEDYIYAALLPVSQFDAQLEGVRNFNTLILCILLILSIVGVALITTISYRPLNKIVQTIRIAKDPAGAAKNEITLILNGIEDIQKKNAGLTHQVYSGIGYIRNYALWLLLYGHSQSVSGEIFQNLLELANIPDTQREYAVSLFKKKSSPEPDKQGAEMQYLIQYGVQDALKELVEQTDAGYCVELPDQNVTALILQVSRGQNDWKEELEETLSAILDHIQKNFQYDCYTGVGSPVALAELVQSFEQAQKALVQSVIKNLNGVQFWEEGQPAPSSFLMPLKQEIDLITAVKRGDAEACRCEMEKIVQQLKNSSFPPHTIQFIWSGLMTHLWQALGDLNIDLGAQYLLQLQQLSARRMQPLEYLEQETISLLDEVCQIVQKKKRSRNHGLYTDILNFLDANYSDPSLNVETVASRFQISASYLSRFFREQHGETLSRYLDDLRMNRAKHLLRTSSAKIREIIQECGYADEANFIRKFKKQEGITPMQYREAAFTNNIKENQEESEP